MKRTLASKVLSSSINLLGRWNRRDLAERLAAFYCRWRPRDSFGWATWGKVLKSLKRPEDAENAFRAGLTLHPQNPDITWLLAKVLRSRSADSEAEALLNDSMKVHPDSYLPYLGLVELALFRGLPKKALRWADKAEERIEPGEFGKMYELALPLGLANLPETQARAIPLLERATMGWPRFVPAHTLLGLLLELQDEYDSRAQQHLAAARRYWDNRDSFEEFIEIQREYFKDRADGNLSDCN